MRTPESSAAFPLKRVPLRSGARRLAWITAALVAGIAAAQPSPLPGFELERLELDTTGAGSLVMGTGELLPAGSIRLALLGGYEHAPLVLSSEGQELGALVEHRVTTYLLGAVTPVSWLELGVQLPVVLVQRGEDLSAVGISQPAAGGQVGTPSLHGRVGLLSEEKGNPVNLAFELAVGLPLGSPEALSRDDGVRLVPRAMVGRTWGPLRGGLELSGLFHTSRNPEALPGAAENELRLGGVIGSTVGPLRAELNVKGTAPLSASPEARRSVEVLVGVRAPVGSSLEGVLLAGPDFGGGPGTPAFRVLLGLEWVTAVPRCASVLRHRPEQCPDLDDDGDGVKNGADACALVGGHVDARGCPMPDSDGDGLLDDADRCPTAPGPAERHGCPIPDADKDGIADELDECPRDAGPAALEGCPDADGDGIADRNDQCPLQAGPASWQGCPAPEERWPWVHEVIYFESGESTLSSSSLEQLDKVAKELLAHSEVEEVAVEGHTDDQVSVAESEALAKARAEAVRDYLIEQWVAPSRLVARGYGQARPVLPNTTARGRTVNRRVELRILRERAEPSRELPGPRSGSGRCWEGVDGWRP